MGFYLWIADDVAWAQGTYEYRPMGSAVVSVSDLFTRRDFDARRKLRPPTTASFEGQFASLGHINQFLTSRRGGRLTSVAKRGSRSVRRRL